MQFELPSDVEGKGTILILLYIISSVHSLCKHVSLFSWDLCKEIGVFPIL